VQNESSTYTPGSPLSPSNSPQSKIGTMTRYWRSRRTTLSPS
jgi:hypothetical protein